jgi:hypothetical protein
MGLEMTFLIMGCSLIGVILGRLYKWTILIPILSVAIVVLVFNPERGEIGLLGALAQIFAVSVSLQIGYGIGVITRGLRIGVKRTKDSGDENTSGTLAAKAASREGGRRAA